MEKKVIIIGAVSYYVLSEFDRQARELGLDACYIFAGENSPEGWRGCSLNIVDLEADRAEQLYELLYKEGIEPVSIVPGGELAVPLVDALARRCSLPHDKGDISRFRDKALMRDILFRGGVSQPEVYNVLPLELSMSEIDQELSGLDFPVIMKPADGAASFFVKKCFSYDEIKENLRKIREHKKSGVTGVSFTRTAILEQYIAGDEYSAEILVLEGKLLNFFLHRKILSREPYFDEIGHITVPREWAQDIPGLVEFLSDAVFALEAPDGVLHLEFRVTREGKIFLIEVASRIAGDLVSYLVRYSRNLSLERFLIIVRGDKRVKERYKLDEFHHSRDSLGIYGVKFTFSDELAAVPDGIEILEQDKAASYQKNSTYSPLHVVNREGYKIFKSYSFAISLLYVTNSSWRFQAFTSEHIQSVKRIYNYNIQNTPYSLETVGQDEAYFLPYLAESDNEYHDLFVICEDDIVLGYGGLYPFFRRGGYQYTREVFFYVDKDIQRKGIGTLLLLYLEELARKRNLCTIIGLVESSNIASKELLLSKGKYQFSGHMSSVGYKFNRLLSLDIYQRSLPGRASLSGIAYDIIVRNLAHLSFYQDFRAGIINRIEYQLILENNIESLLLTELDIDLINLSARMPLDVDRSLDDTLRNLWEQGIVPTMEYNKEGFTEFSGLVAREFHHENYLTYIFPEEAQLLYALSDLVRPRKIAVIGSYYGSWGIWAAATLEASDLIYFIDPNREVLDLAKDNIGRLKIRATVEYLAIDALEDEVQLQELDMIVLDAEGPKSHPENIDITGKAIYFPLIQKFFSCMNPKGILVVHNMLLKNITSGKYFEMKVEKNRAELRKFIDFLDLNFLNTYIYDSTEGISISVKA